MIPRASRIDRSDFSRILRNGRRVHRPAFSLVISPTESSSMAVVVSKKVAKSAVDRNKIRRRIYAILKDVLPEKVSIVLITKPLVREYSHAELSADIKNALTSFGTPSEAR